MTDPHPDQIGEYLRRAVEHTSGPLRAPLHNILEAAASIIASSGDDGPAAARAGIADALNRLWTGSGTEEQIIDILSDAYADLGYGRWRPPQRAGQQPIYAAGGGGSDWADAETIYRAASEIQETAADDEDELIDWDDISAAVARIRSTAEQIIEQTSAGAAALADALDRLWTGHGDERAAIGMAALALRRLTGARWQAPLHAPRFRFGERRPAVAAPDGLNAHITPALDPADVGIDLSGSVQVPATRQTLVDHIGLTDFWAGNGCHQWMHQNDYGDVPAPLSTWFAGHEGGPDDVWVLTGNGEGRLTSWPQPTWTLTLPDAATTKITDETVLVDNVLWDNRGGDSPQEDESEISQSVEITTETSWSHSVDWGESVECGVSAGPADSKESLTRTESWGQGGSTSKTVDVGDSDRIRGTVPAGEAWVAALTLRRGTVTVDVHAQGHLDHGGYILCHMSSHEHHHNRTVPVRDQNGDIQHASWVAVPIVEALTVSQPGREFYSRADWQIKTTALAEAILASHPIRPTPVGPISDEAVRRAAGAHDPVTVYP